MYNLGFCMDYKNVVVMNISLPFYVECLTVRATACVCTLFTPSQDFKAILYLHQQFHNTNSEHISVSRSQRPRDPRRGSAIARLLVLWVRIPGGYGYLSLVIVVF
jgi:hypothetical protein